MQTFAFKNCPIIPAHQLWVAGLLMNSGGRADAGLARLQAARRPAGDRSSKGEEVPDAWGASGTDSPPASVMGAVSRRVGGRVAECVMVERAATVQWEGTVERLKGRAYPGRGASPGDRGAAGG